MPRADELHAGDRIINPESNREILILTVRQDADGWMRLGYDTGHSNRGAANADTPSPAMAYLKFAPDLQLGWIEEGPITKYLQANP